MNAEPELEDLSAYVDQELTGTAWQELEAHLQTCETCRRRLAALRQTVSAVKALPTEAPPRPFTIPPQRQQRRATTGWAWAGGALAAACLVLVVTVALANVGHPGGGGATTAAPLSGSNAYTSTGADRGVTAPAPFSNVDTVKDPQNGSTQLTLATAGRSYAASGSLQVSLTLQGVPGDAVPTSLADARIQLSLVRDGFAVQLQNPDAFSAVRDHGLVRISAAYRLSQLTFPGGAPGDYTLRATWQVPDGSGVSLVAQVPITLTP